jgi:hypothetical protein
MASQKVVHYIVTTGLPTAAKFRGLDDEKLEVAKAEFRQLEAGGIIQGSTSPWATVYQLLACSFFPCTWRLFPPETVQELQAFQAMTNFIEDLSLQLPRP